MSKIYTTQNSYDIQDDTARRIHKGDIYFCDPELDSEESNKVNDAIFLNKPRFYVIVSSPKFNTYKNDKYYAAPIRTEHKYVVNDDTIEDIVKIRRRQGRIYIPIKLQGKVYFIDMTHTTLMPVEYIKKYKSTILNKNILKRIDDALYDIFLADRTADDKQDTDHISIPLQSETVISTCKYLNNYKQQQEKKKEEKVSVTVTKNESIPKVVKNNPDFKQVCDWVISKEINRQSGAELLDIAYSSFCKIIVRYQAGEFDSILK